MNSVGIPNIAGHTLEGDQAALTALVKKERKPYKGTTTDPWDDPYIPVSGMDIDTVDLIFSLTPTARAADRINRETLLHGGLTVQIGHADPMKLKVSDEHGRGLLQFLALANHYWDMYGFFVATAIEPMPSEARLFSKLEDTFKDLPKQCVILNMSQIEVTFRVDVFGKYHWLVRHRPKGPVFQTDDERIIPGVLVFAQEGHLPHPTTGALRSQVISLRDEFYHMRTLRQLSEAAERNRAQPVLVTERVTQQKDPTVHASVPYHGRSPWSGKDDCMDTTSDGIEEEKLRRRDFALAVERKLHLMQSSLTNEQFHMLSGHMPTLLALQDQQTDRIDLPHDRKLARQLPASAPADLIKHELQWKQSVFHVFGIPDGMIMAESSHGKVTLNDNARQLFDLHMASLKQQLLPVLQILLRHIYRGQLALRTLARTPLNKKLTRHDVEDSTRIVIQMPGIPPMAELDAMYMSGILTYQYYIACKASVYGMPLEAFEKTPKLSVRDHLDSGKDHSLETQARLNPPEAKPKAKPKAKGKKK